MQITIWSDFVCPFCFIGATHLDKALANFNHTDEVEITYKSFQLEPGAQYVPDRTYKEAMIERKGASPEQIDQMFGQVTEMAQSAGLDYDFEIMKLTDTYPAHRVFQYANEEGKGVEYFNKLYEAFFLNGELISDAAVLIRVADEIGIDSGRVAEILENDKEYDKKVVKDIYEAQQVGAQGVPFFVFNNKYAVSGAQPVEVFSQVLNQVYEEENGANK